MDRNLLLAIALSLLVVSTWTYWEGSQQTQRASGPSATTPVPPLLPDRSRRDLVPRPRAPKPEATAAKPVPSAAGIARHERPLARARDRNTTVRRAPVVSRRVDPELAADAVSCKCEPVVGERGAGDARGGRHRRAGDAPRRAGARRSRRRLPSAWRNRARATSSSRIGTAGSRSVSSTHSIRPRTT